nr:hypothetical protein pFRL5_228 [Streptomyces sp. F8]
MSRDGARSDAFLEHQCHFPAQMEDIMNPAPTLVHQPSGIERRPTPVTVRRVDDTRCSARLDTRWVA